MYRIKYKQSYEGELLVRAKSRQEALNIFDKKLTLAWCKGQKPLNYDGGSTKVISARKVKE